MYYFERLINGNASLAGRGPFVAAFFQVRMRDEMCVVMPLVGE
jgi:hypothetical protein